MREKLKVITLSKRWPHHTKSGGYDRLEKELNSYKIQTAHKENYLLPGKIRRLAWKKIMPSGRYVNCYNFQDFKTEVNVFIKEKKIRPSLIHSLYADDQLNLILKYRNKLHCALVGTYHLPAESQFVRKVVKTGKYSRLKVIDAAIVVSNSMISEYERWVGEGKVFFVPHGIDTDVFCPEEKKIVNLDKNLKILIVGGHGRDWDTVEKVIRHFQQTDKQITFSAVVPDKVRKKLSHLSNLKMFTGIPESHLISLYRETQLLLIPVNFATANNSLLEALSCGTPVISTNTGGIPDYLNENCGWLLPQGDVKSMIELIEHLIKRPDEIIPKSEAARSKAMEFDWEKISKQVDHIHEFAFESWKRKISSVT